MKTIQVNRFTLLLLLIALGNHGYAQRGYSTAGLAMGKMRSLSGTVPAPQEIIVEEYMNYHTHQLPLLKKNASVAMDLQWGNPYFNHETQEFVLQVGLTTGMLDGDYSNVLPLNLSLVIDKSGSMSGDRIQKTREACKELIKRLRPQDMLSIVAFDHRVTVLFPAQKTTDQATINQAIDRIIAGGSTDLHSGLLTGYREVQKNYSSNYTNKVIILTDAITNTGTVDPDAIVKSSDNFQEDQSIDVTLIGVGVDFNNGLSRKLTNSIKSTIHFIDDTEDIKKVFIDEVESLLSPVARNIALEITYDSQLEVVTVYGYEPVFKGNQVLFDLNNMNSGLTQVILIKFKKTPYCNTNIDIKAMLRFRDIQKRKDDHITQAATLILDDNRRLKPESLFQSLVSNPVVKKNYSIAVMVQAFKDMAVNYKQGQKSEAQKVLQDALQFVNNTYPALKDKDIIRVKDILERYIKTMDDIVVENSQE